MSEFKQKSVNSNFRKAEAKQIKSVYRRTKIMLQQLLSITEQSPFSDRSQLFTAACSQEHELIEK